MELGSWGRYPKVASRVRTVRWRTDLQSPLGPGSFLPYGQGRSYGDSCLNDGGTLLHTRALNRFISFDEQQGILRCEAGVTLAEILEFSVPRGWFPPVVPGTKFVTVGGAIANDIHGKNHHREGTFGRHVLEFELLRSDGRKLFCTPEINGDLFRATIGGLGLTGMILSCAIKLRSIPGPAILQETVQFHGIEEFFSISTESDKTHEYTAAWLDCTARGEEFARGIFFRGNHSDETIEHRAGREGGARTVPIDLPSFSLNRYTVTAFNWCYFHKQRRKSVERLVHYEPFFFPLDSVQHWNRIYGRRGFLQFQCVVPPETAREALREILERVVETGEASFLAVLKEFGSVPSPGMLSFPRPGTTLCLDFSMRGSATLALMRELERTVMHAGGALYPAKDACMSGEGFRRHYFPRWEEFSKLVDPQFSSSFWRRVMRR